MQYTLVYVQHTYSPPHSWWIGDHDRIPAVLPLLPMHIIDDGKATNQEDGKPEKVVLPRGYALQRVDVEVDGLISWSVDPALNNRYRTPAGCVIMRHGPQQPY